MLDRLRSEYAFLLAGLRQRVFAAADRPATWKKAGFDTITATCRKRRCRPFRTSPPCFISSQHPSCSAAAFRIHWEERRPFPTISSPLEIIRRLRPACSVFVPHDLEAPIRPYEFAYMTAFDIYCAPSKQVNPALHRLCKVVPAGWVKHHGISTISPPISRRWSRPAACSS
jgi:hypothetical protein